MSEPHSPTGAATDRNDEAVVVCANEQDEVSLDVERYRVLAADVLAVQETNGELTLTFVETGEIAALNSEHMGKEGPTDVLSFPLDAAADDDDYGVRLLGDVVICPAVAELQAPTHAGSLDDELALLVVHGVLHVLGWDHATPDETRNMRARERELLSVCFWHGDAPTSFRQQVDPEEVSGQ